MRSPHRVPFLPTFLLAVLLGGALLSSCSSCSQGFDPPGSGRTVRIGAILSLSGRYSLIDEPTRKAVDYFVNHYKEVYAPQNNITYDLQVLDAGSDPIKAVEEVEQMWQKNPPQILLLSTSAIAMAVAPHIKNRDVLVIANAGHPDLIGAGNAYTFSTFPDIPDECELFVNYADQVGASRIFLLHPSDVYHQADAACLQRSQIGPKVVGDEQYQEGTTDFGLIVSKLQRNQTDCLLLFGFGISYPSIYAELARQNFKGNVIVDTDFLYNPIDKYDKSILAKTVFVGPAWITDKNQFLDKYQSDNGAPMPYFATFILDGLRLAMKASEGTDSVPEMAKSLMQVNNEKLLSGIVSVRADRHFQYQLRLYREENGKFVVVGG